MMNCEPDELARSTNVNWVHRKKSNCDTACLTINDLVPIIAVANAGLAEKIVLLKYVKLSARKDFVDNEHFLNI